MNYSAFVRIMHEFTCIRMNSKCVHNCALNVCADMHIHTYVYAYVFSVSSSVTNATATLDTPNNYRTLHTITVNCTINPDSIADMCEVIAIANGQTLNGNCKKPCLSNLTFNCCTCICMYVIILVRTYICGYVCIYLY